MRSRSTNTPYLKAIYYNAFEQCRDGPSYLNSFPNRIHWQILVRTFPDHILSTNKVVGINKDFVYKNYNNNKKKQVILIRGST